MFTSSSDTESQFLNKIKSVYSMPNDVNPTMRYRKNCPMLFGETLL